MLFVFPKKMIMKKGGNDLFVDLEQKSFIMLNHAHNQPLANSRKRLGENPNNSWSILYSRNRFHT